MKFWIHTSLENSELHTLKLENFTAEVWVHHNNPDIINCIIFNDTPEIIAELNELAKSESAAKFWCETYLREMLKLNLQQLGESE
jgi:hypothetical protein